MMVFHRFFIGVQLLSSNERYWMSEEIYSNYCVYFMLYTECAFWTRDSISKQNDLVTTCNYCSVYPFTLRQHRRKTLGASWGQSAHSVQRILPLLSTQPHELTMVAGSKIQASGFVNCSTPSFLRCRHYEQQGRRFWSQRPDIRCNRNFWKISSCTK